MLSSKLKDVAWQIGGAFFNRGSFFFAMLILASKLPIYEYGELGFSLLIVNSISGILAPSLGLVLRSEVITLGESDRLIHFTINSVIIFLFSLIAVAVVGFYMYLFLNNFGGVIYLILLFFNCLFLTLYNFSSYYFAGTGQFKKYNLRTAWIGPILIPLIYFFPFSNIEIVLGFFLVVYTAMILNLFHGLKILKNIKEITVPRYRDYIIERRNLIFPIFFQSLVNLPVLSIIQFLIIFFTSNFYLIGIITFSTQVVNLVSIVVNRINSVTIPNLNKIIGDTLLFRKRVRNELRNLFLISFLGSVLIVIFLPYLIEIIKPEMSGETSGIQFFIIANILTYLYWFCQEANIILENNWKVFYANLLWATLVVFITLFWLSFKLNFSLISYVVIVIGSRGLVVSYLLKRIFYKPINHNDKIYI